MTHIKKFIRKLYHLIWFLSCFLIFACFSPNDVLASAQVNASISGATEQNLLDNTIGRFSLQNNLWKLEKSSYYSSFALSFNNASFKPYKGSAINFSFGMFQTFQNYNYNSNVSFSDGYIVSGSKVFSCDVDIKHTDASYNYWYNSYPSTAGPGAGNYFATNSDKYQLRTFVNATCHIDDDYEFPANYISFVFRENGPSHNYTEFSLLSNFIVFSEDTSTPAINNVNDSVNNVNDSINDNSVDSSDSTINNLNSNLPTNSVISDLILLPVTFLQKLVNSLGGSCSQFSLGSLLGTNLVMPCINLSNYLGSALWTTIDLIFSGMFVLIIRKKFVDIFNNITQLKERGNEVE